MKKQYESENMPGRSLDLNRLVRRYQKKTGEEIWITLSIKPITDREQTKGFLANWIDITEQNKLREDKEYYLSQITRIQEEERKRISRELHDDTAQYLSLLVLELDTLADQEENLTQKAKDTLKRLCSAADQAVKKVRRFSHELHPSVLEKFGLSSALELLVSEFYQTGDIMARFDSEGDEKRLSNESELALFRIAQESLNNIRKHSQASQAFVKIEYLEDRVRLRTRDNGKGFYIRDESYSAVRRGSLGLISMRERAALVGAEIKITSLPGKGTVVTVELKYPN